MSAADRYPNLASLAGPPAGPASNPAIGEQCRDALAEIDRLMGTAWTVTELPCPDCGNYTMIGHLYRNEVGEHMHTRYLCTFWPKGDYSDRANPVTHRPCDWAGWSVPGWDDPTPRAQGGWDTDADRAAPAGDADELRQWVSDACELLHELDRRGGRSYDYEHSSGNRHKVLDLLRRAENP